MTQILYGKNHGRFPQTPLDWANCGTEANYRAHLRRGEKACKACRRANSRATLERRRKRARS